MEKKNTQKAKIITNKDIFMNPFSKKQNKLSQVDEIKPVQDPLSVEDLLIDGTAKATITSDGRLLSKKDALKDNEEHIDLLKQREWGSNGPTK